MRSNGYAPRYNVPANPGARNLPMPGEAPAGGGSPQPPSDPAQFDPYNPPKPVWSKIGNGYDRFRQRRTEGSTKIPPVAPNPDTGYANGGYGTPEGFGGGNGSGDDAKGPGFGYGGYGSPASGNGGYGGYGGGYGGSRGAPPSRPGYASHPSYASQQGGGYGSQARAGPTAQEELEAEYGAAPGHAGEEEGEGNQQEMERTESDEEVEAVKQQMRFTKQESLSSSRNALRMAREAEETAMNSMMRLGDQSEKLADTERNLDLSKAYAHRADDNAREVERLNSSIFRPQITFNKSSKRAAQEARIINRHIDEREERERLRAEAYGTQRRVEDSLGGPGSSSRFNSSRFAFGRNKDLPAEDPQAAKLTQRARYQFEATGSDDELEDELDDNLGNLGHIAGNLNRLGKAMGTEIDDQNRRVGRLGDKTSNLDTKVYASTMRLENLH